METALDVSMRAEKKTKQKIVKKNQTNVGILLGTLKYRIKLSGRRHYSSTKLKLNLLSFR